MAQTQPRILLITTDQQRYDTAGDPRFGIAKTLDAVVALIYHVDLARMGNRNVRRQDKLAVAAAFGIKPIALRPDYIVDSHAGIGRDREKLKDKYRNRWVCRHDLAEACRLAIESTATDHDVLHVVGTSEAKATCNVEYTQKMLRLEFLDNLDKYK